jgi:hypothetical protein
MADVAEYNASLDGPLQEVAERLAARIAPALPDAAGQLWHGHPVWLEGGNPVAGYKAFPRWVTLLFWRGRQFSDTAGLAPTGSAQMSSMRLSSPSELDALPLGDWLAQARILGGWTR